MDDNYEDLDSDISPARERRRKAKGARPVSMPPATIDEDLPYDEGSVSDPEYLPEPVEKPQKKSKIKKSKIKKGPSSSPPTRPINPPIPSPTLSTDSEDTYQSGFWAAVIRGLVSGSQVEQ